VVGGPVSAAGWPRVGSRTTGFPTCRYHNRSWKRGALHAPHTGVPDTGPPTVSKATKQDLIVVCVKLDRGGVEIFVRSDFNGEDRI